MLKRRQAKCDSAIGREALRAWNFVNHDRSWRLDANEQTRNILASESIPKERRRDDRDPG
jgi:hypothetical protein